MKYDFTSIIDRCGKDAICIEGLGAPGGFAPGKPADGFDVIPMWIADMNFPTCPTVTEAMLERIKHPIYGYFPTRSEYYDSIIQWHSKRNGVVGLEKKHIGYENGVLGGLISALNSIAARGDKILVHSPTYVGFTRSLSNNGYRLVLSPLVKDENSVYRMDFADMEEKIVKEGITTALLCSPHNPSGRVWEKWELERAMELFEKYGVKVVCDEIWSDIILNGHKHIPAQSVNEYAKQNTIALYAPSKTFNLAGLVGSYHIIYNEMLKKRVDKESSLSHYNNANVISMHALIGAYKPEGYEWVDELCQTLSSNVNFAVDYINEHFDGLEVSKPQGTYILFVDCEKWCEKHNKTLDEVLKACWDVGVAIQDGRNFNGKCHIRMNLALPHSRVKEAFERMSKYVFNA